LHGVYRGLGIFCAVLRRGFLGHFKYRERGSFAIILGKYGDFQGGVFAAGMEGEIELLRFGKALTSFSHHGDTESTEIQAK
jgi:hypothetical protein